MASPASSSSSSSGPPAASLSEEDLDRRLQQRLAKLSESAPIHLSLPPPSAEQLEERLRRLEASNQTHSDEAELHRRFQRLNGEAVAASSSAASSSPALYSSRDIQLAGHGAVLSEQEEIDALLLQVQQQSQLENGGGGGGAPPAGNGAPPAMPSPSDWTCEECQNLNFGRRTVCNRCQHARPLLSLLANGGGVGAAPAHVASSPPPPSRSEVAKLMRELQSLPDTDLIAAQPHHRAASISNNDTHTPSKRKEKQTRAKGEEEEESQSNSESESETDADVQAIIDQAHDEASMEQ